MTAEVFKIAAVVIIAALMSLLLKSYRAEYSFLLTVSAGCVILTFLFIKTVPLVNQLKSVFDKAGVNGGYFTAVLKALGISYISSFAADTCRDFGQSSLGAKAEFCGKIGILIICIPMMLDLINIALGFI